MFKLEKKIELKDLISWLLIILLMAQLHAQGDNGFDYERAMHILSYLYGG